MSNLTRKMETCANIAIILAGLAAACLFIQKFAAGRAGSANRGRASHQCRRKDPAGGSRLG